MTVFGDDVNDREMLSAKYETTDNNNDGIHYAIRNILHIV